MSFMNIGSIGSYMKNMKLQTQWQLKKESGELTKKQKSLQEWIDETTASLDKLKAENQKKAAGNVDVQAIYIKVQNGKKLTAEEKNYLRTNDPQMYEKVKSIERESKAYEEEIKRCKTKEDVQRVKTARINQSLSTVKSIENNPHISQAQKLGYATIELAKIKAIEEITLKFVKSGEYTELPTDAEYAEAMKELNEQKKPEELQDKEEAEVELPDMPDGDRTADAEKVVEKVLDSEKEIEVESEELKKAKRAKAKAAYQKMGSEWDEGEILTFQTSASFDVKG